MLGFLVDQGLCGCGCPTLRDFRRVGIFAVRSVCVAKVGLHPDDSGTDELAAAEIPRKVRRIVATHWHFSPEDFFAPDS